MAKVVGEFTMQGRDTPVSAAGQGEQAGPQASSSCDRSSSCVGNLAHVEYNASRKKLHECGKNPDFFCYICSKYEVGTLRKKIDDEIKTMYIDCFGCEILHQETNWVPHIICNSCRLMLYRWKNKKERKYIKFSAPTVWKKPCYLKACYFCMNDIKGITMRNKNTISYINVPTVIRAIEMTTNERNRTDHMDTIEEQNDIDMEVDLEMEMETDTIDVGGGSDNDEKTDSEDEFVSYDSKSNLPILVSQPELSDLVRDLGLPKDGAELLASFFKKRNFLKPNTKVSYYRDRDKDFRKYFTKDEEMSFVYCKDIKGLMDQLKKDAYKSEEWRLFIDSSIRSIKFVLLHNTNVYAPIPIAHSVTVKEEYNNLQRVLEKIKYADHKWRICGDLKIITMILGQQSGFTKNPCFLCLWDSRDRTQHYKKKHWPQRTSFTVGSKNIIKENLVDPEKVLFPPLHLKLGLMKQFVKALDKEGDCFQYIGRKFQNISEAKLKEGVFDGPQIRTLFKDTTFISTMSSVEKSAWTSFKAVTTKFLGNNKSPNYEEIVSKMIKDFQELGCLMNYKLHFLHSHLDWFPENLGDYSEEQGERFHQDMKVIEQRYQGRWDENMMADFCWLLKRETKNRGTKRKRNPLHRSFEEKRTRYSNKNK